MDEKQVFTITSYFTHHENGLSAVLHVLRQKTGLSLAKTVKTAPALFYAPAWLCTALHDRQFQAMTLTGAAFIAVN